MTVVEPDEKVVEEVHCVECNAPIPAIPAWYAQVRVKFTCDTCRQKSPRLAAALPTAALGTERVAAVADDVEPGLDDVALDPEIADDLDVDEPDTDDTADE